MRQEQTAVMVGLVDELGEQVGLVGACQALGVPRSWYYRQKAPPMVAKQPGGSGPTPANALNHEEKQEVRVVLNSQRFCDQPPREVYATMLDEGKYLCHWRTMYRILEEHGEVGDRRGQRQHVSYAKPELVARAPNEIWSWDISFLAGPGRRTFYYLYNILDIFSRFVVGWMIASAESSQWAQAFIEATCAKQNISREQLTLHADRGSAMRANGVAELLERLGVTKSHSRPHTPNDNPFSEAQFKTLKHHPTFPETFADIQAARSWAREFFQWYNHQHHHVALGLMTPAVVHSGQAAAVIIRRQQVLDEAYARHPERFASGAPQAPQLPQEVWINPPEATSFSRTAPVLSASTEQTESPNDSIVLEPVKLPAAIELARSPFQEEISSLFLDSELSHFP
jgi:putative transposase